MSVLIFVVFQAGQGRSIYPACHKVPVSRFPGCMQDLHQDWLHQPFITWAGEWRVRLPQTVIVLQLRTTEACCLAAGKHGHVITITLNQNIL